MYQRVEPKQPRAHASRDRLLEATVEELIEGRGELAVQSVAARAGVSTGLVYRYFGSRAGLIAAVVDAFYDRVDELMHRQFPELSWPDAERLRTRLGINLFYDTPAAPVILGRMGWEPEIAAVEARRVRRYVELASLNIRRGQELGVVSGWLDPDVAGAMTLGGIRAALVQATVADPRPDRDALADQLWRFVVAMLTAPADLEARSA